MPETSPFTTRFALADSEFVGPVVGAHDSWQDAERAVSDRPDARVIVTAYESDGRLPLAWEEDSATSVWEAAGYGVYPATRRVDEHDVHRWIAFHRSGSQPAQLASTDSRARALAACEAHAHDRRALA